ncbi:hypothetical protein [uncultured Roseovarius sp.]|uniref:hypothetical protein n=1 Tax=uncultured Roseovarius sp. TaxID=293344 RepID=UPI00345BC72F
MTAEEFEAYTTGKTFYYGNGGAPYGAEEYLSGRYVRWSFLDGDCKEGRWFTDEGGLICFTYEDRPEPQCWSFLQGPNGLIARYENDPQATELYEVRQSDEPLECPGPKVGV